MIRFVDYRLESKSELNLSPFPLHTTNLFSASSTVIKCPGESSTSSIVVYKLKKWTMDEAIQKVAEFKGASDGEMMYKIYSKGYLCRKTPVI